MAEKLAMPEEAFVRTLFASGRPPLCLRSPSFPDNQETLEQLRLHIEEILDTLSYRERSILQMRFGLGDGYAYTLAETGYVFKLTRERIRQLQARALARLRGRADELRSFLDGLIV